MHLSNNKKARTTTWVLIALLAAALVYLIVDHWQHVAPYSVFAFLLGCLMMHLFMHHGHGGQRDHGSHDTERNI